jgi:cytochrome b561
VWKSSPDHYGRIAIAIHWISAVMIAGLLISGVRASGMADPVAKAALLRIHAPVGVAILGLTLVRLGWWRMADQKPRDPAGLPRPQIVAARAVQGLFYVAILGLALSGIAVLVLSGAGDILFGNASGPLPDFWDAPPRYGHAAMALLLAVLLVLHVGAALYHQFVLGDRLLARMGVGK